MSRSRSRLAAGLTPLLLFSSTSCTIGKPIVCAFSTPVIALGHGSGDCGCDPRGLACGLVALSAVGVVGGLVTGIISDINYLSGDVEDPFRNLADPFATNTSKSSF